jgi:hypothetical protein
VVAQATTGRGQQQQKKKDPEEIKYYNLAPTTTLPSLKKL